MKILFEREFLIILRESRNEEVGIQIYIKREIFDDRVSYLFLKTLSKLVHERNFQCIAICNQSQF